jgi:hypothetical protein
MRPTATSRGAPTGSVPVRGVDVNRNYDWLWDYRR